MQYKVHCNDRQLTYSTEGAAAEIAGALRHFADARPTIETIYELNGHTISVNLRRLIGRSGMAVSSIAYLRELTGAGLKDAKDFYDACVAEA